MLKRDYFLGLVEKFSQHFSARIREFLLKNVHSGFASLDVFRQPAPALKLSLITASIWSAAVLANYWILLALDIQAPLAASLLVLVAVQAGISLPSLPGKIGVFELTCILALEVIRGQPGNCAELRYTFTRGCFHSNPDPRPDIVLISADRRSAVWLDN